MYLLDTNVVSELRKVRAGRSDPGVATWADQVEPGSLFLSTITLHELELGVLLIERRDAQQGFLLRQWLEQAVLAERQAERDYAEGINPNILSVLEAQRRANNARASMIRLRNQRLQNRINLHLALGGDFHTKP